MVRTGFRGAVCLVLVCLFLFFVSSCTSREKYAGTYTTIVESKGQQVMIIELKENGQGSWRKKEEEASFQWSIKNSEIRFRTKEGGIILGSIQGDSLAITLPNERRMVFKRSQ